MDCDRFDCCFQTFLLRLRWLVVLSCTYFRSTIFVLATGKGDDEQFRTAQRKEYPHQLCIVLAAAVIYQLRRFHTVFFYSICHLWCYVVQMHGFTVCHFLAQSEPILNQPRKAAGRDPKRCCPSCCSCCWHVYVLVWSLNTVWSCPNPIRGANILQRNCQRILISNNPRWSTYCPLNTTFDQYMSFFFASTYLWCSCSNPPVIPETSWLYFLQESGRGKDITLW